AIFGLTVTVETAGIAAALVLVQAWLSTALFITAHDAMHGAVAPRWPRLQHALGRCALMIYAGIDFARMAPAHFDHHKYAGTAGDPDFNARDPRAFGPWLTRFFTGYYSWWQTIRLTGVGVIYTLLGASFANIMLFWALPSLLAVLQLFYFGTYLPHRHDDGAAFADRHRTRSLPMSDLASLVSCFHFGGYHHEHHLSPSTPWWRLPTVRAAYAERRAVTSSSVRPNSASA
ncbi:MAG: fatty acid desaturase, partial [Pseudomonadota bacterium]